MHGMRVAWFAFLHDSTDAALAVSEADFGYVRDVVAATPGLARGMLFTPWEVDGLPFDDGIPPQLALQLVFDDIADLEAALAPAGHLQALAAPGALSSLAGAEREQQAMLTRGFAVPEPASGEPSCSFLVHYPGPAADVNAWMAHYLEHHPRIMATFPAIREIEVCSRIEWCGFLPWPRVDHMQRNKVVFDDAGALRAALASPVMREMRADFHALPPFAGGNRHYPMRTVVAGP